MARKINENVVDINSAPKKRQSAKAKAAAEAQRLREDESRGLKGPSVSAAEAEAAIADMFERDGSRPTLQTLIAARSLASQEGRDTSKIDAAIAARQAEGAPASDRTVGLADNGHAELTPGIFLRWVQKLNTHEAKGEELKLKLKEWRTERKLLRKEANGDRIVLAQLDEALDDLKTEQVDLLAREQRRRDYHEWLGIPLVAEQEMAEISDPDRLAARWKARGVTAGRLGQVREVPEGCPPECIPAYLTGHDEGQMLLMQKLPLTKGGFDDFSGRRKPREDEDGTRAKTEVLDKISAESSPLLVLKEGHFQAGTELEDANLKTLLAGHHEAFHNAVSVIAIFGQRRRILKELDAEAPGGVYVDDGVEAPVSEPEAVGPGAADLA